MVIAAVCPMARSLGLHPRMAVTKARALVPNLDIRFAEPEADDAFLIRLGLFAARHWTPRAALSGPAGLRLDLAGVCAHLFGGEQKMCKRILRFCSRIGFGARIAIAGTTGAAHALAHFGGQRISLCPNGGELDAIAGFPPAALRLDDHAIDAARRFGIDTVGEITGIARGPLARRFGSSLLLRLDQATGRADEPFDPIILEEPPRAMLRFLEPIASTEAIAQVLSDLVANLTVLLERDGIAARTLTLTCERVDGEEQRLAIGIARASRDPRHLLHLLTMQVERIEPGFGIEAMHLLAGRCEPLAPQQIGGDTPETDLPELVHRIAARIGSRRLFHSARSKATSPNAASRGSRRSILPRPGHVTGRGRCVCWCGPSWSTRSSPSCPTNRRCASRGAGRCTGCARLTGPTNPW